MFAFGVILAFATAFMVLDYNEVIEVGICQNIGLKPSGTFDIFSSTDYLFSSDDKQLLTFYCKPPRGYAPTLKGECSEEFVDDGQYSNKGDIKKRDGIYTVNVFVTESKSKTIEFYALAKKGLKFYESNHIKIEIKDNWTNEEQKNIDKVDTSIQELINSDSYKKKDYENKVKSVKQLLDQLSTNGTPSINKKSLFFDEKSGLYNFSYSKTGPTAGKYSVKIPVSMTPGVYQIVIQVINSNDQILFERAHIVNVKSTINFIGFVGGTDTGDIRSKYYGDTSRKLEVHCVSDKISQYEQTNITFNIHGTFYSRVMENGIAYLGINLSNGEYIVTVTSPLNGETITENITIIPSE